MFCKYCGAQIPDQSAFCQNCGAALDQPQPGAPTNQTYGAPPQGQYAPQQQQPYGAPRGQYAPQQTYAAPQGQYAPQQTGYAAPQYAAPQQGYGAYQAALPMNWHKFLVYFALWASAVLNIFSAVSVLTGAQYVYDGNNYSEIVYSSFEGLRAVDTVYGIALIGLAVFGFITASAMLKMKQGAPDRLRLLYIVGAAVSVVYTIAASSIISGKTNVDTSSIVSTAVGTVIGSVIFILINNVYYKKREFMFVN